MRVLEAARIDGANVVYIFHKIRITDVKKRNLQYCDLPVPLGMGGFPVAIPGNYKQRQTASCRLVLRCLTDSIPQIIGALFAATAISIIPVLLIYLFFQKQFIAGIAASAVKG